MSLKCDFLHKRIDTSAPPAVAGKKREMRKRIGVRINRFFVLVCVYEKETEAEPEEEKKQINYIHGVD